jgi:hypothetical protein
MEKKIRERFAKVSITLPSAEKQWLIKRANAEKKSLSALIVELCGAERDAKDGQIFSMARNIEEIGLGIESLSKQLKQIKHNQRIPAASLVAQCYQRVEDLHRRSGTASSQKLEEETGDAINAFLELGDGLMKTHGDKHGN